MEAEKVERSRSPSSSSPKRKPLSDSTNLLIPTSAILGKLSSSLSTTTPFPNSKPYNSKPYNPDTNSDTSIGSSNHNPNPSTTFKTHPSTPSPLSISIPGNGSEEADEPLVVYSRRQTIEKTKKKGKAVAVPFTCSPLQKTNDKFESVSVSCPPRLKTKDKGKAVAVPPSFSSLGKTKDRENAVSVPISFRSLVNTRNKGKAIAMPCPPLSRTRRRRNEFSEAGKIGLPKSCKVPPAKHKKKRCRVLLEQDVSEHALPQEFIEEQRAYFKEVDDFELPEEEILENELDEEEENYYTK
ncbi:hypothetical protein LOK49_LG01G01042 [Camellia lanceoleosa]|uniref:Uncharacterized protein n=1 Tax=Camellia lanceoleosa TaxID=1840588 RepID=A0ACC0J6Q1_9ERIC|nr:hypothetical protein LOK49_LG01G01042 [Camellia lanceoleosa]